MVKSLKAFGFQAQLPAGITAVKDGTPYAAFLDRWSIPPVPTAAALAAAPLGYNDAFPVEYLPNDPFLNQVKTASFRSQTLTDPSSLASNSNGYPTAIGPGYTWFSLFLATSSISSKNWQGFWKLRFKSEGGLVPKAYLGSLVTNIVTVGNYTTADIEFTTTSNTGIAFERLDGQSGVVDIFDVELFSKVELSPGVTREALYDSGETWNPNYLARYTRGGRRPGFVRSMVWNSVNDWISAADEDTIRTLDHANYGKRTPPEVIADFVNKVNPRFMWVCIPVNATTAYITNYFTKLRDLITTSTVLIVEYVNEIWNYGADFSQTAVMDAMSLRYFADRGLGKKVTGVSVTNSSKTVTLPSGQGALITAGKPVTFTGEKRAYKAQTVVGDVITLDANFAGATAADTIMHQGEFNWRIQMVSVQTEWMRTVLETIYTGDQAWRFNTVLAGQAAGTGNMYLYYTTPAWVAVAPNRPDPAIRHEWYSISSYYGDSAMSQAVVDLFATDPAAALAQLHASLMGTHMTQLENLWSVTKSTLTSLAPLTKLIAYEGGPHVVHSGTALAEAFVPVWTAYRNNATMAAEIIEAWMVVNRMYSDGPGCNFQRTGTKSKFGFWGVDVEGGDAFEAAFNLMSASEPEWY